MVTATATATATAVTSPGAVPDAAAGRVDDVDAEFLALIYSDADLLRAEFEEIIAAASSSPPPSDPTPRRDAEPPPDRTIPHPPPASGRVLPTVVAGVRDRGARTRSPPNIICVEP